MGTPEPLHTVEDVLDAYISSVEHPSYAALQDWIRRYPQFARELTTLTASWSLSEQLPPRREVADEERLLLRGASVVRNVLHQRRAARQEAAETSPMIAGLVAEGTRAGLKLRSLADAVGMSPALVREIDRRLIRLTSIPDAAIQAFAHALRCAPEMVARYLDGPPRFATGAQHRADETPALAEQRDFFAAVGDDTSLSDERRARWLALAPRDE